MAHRGFAGKGVSLVTRTSWSGLAWPRCGGLFALSDQSWKLWLPLPFPKIRDEPTNFPRKGKETEPPVFFSVFFRSLLGNSGSGPTTGRNTVRKRGLHAMRECFEPGFNAVGGRGDENGKISSSKFHPVFIPRVGVVRAENARHAKPGASGPEYSRAPTPQAPKRRNIPSNGTTARYVAPLQGLTPWSDMARPFRTE